MTGIVDTPAGLGDDLMALVTELYPICRSITGDGVRQTLDIVARKLPLEIHEVPSGTPVLDWVVPLEWNIRDAYISEPRRRARRRLPQRTTCTW